MREGSYRWLCSAATVGCRLTHWAGAQGFPNAVNKTGPAHILPTHPAKSETPRKGVSPASQHPAGQSRAWYMHIPTIGQVHQGSAAREVDAEGGRIQGAIQGAGAGNQGVRALKVGPRDSLARRFSKAGDHARRGAQGEACRACIMVGMHPRGGAAVEGSAARLDLLLQSCQHASPRFQLKCSCVIYTCVACTALPCIGQQH